jgi:hypothetical protein
MSARIYAAGAGSAGRLGAACLFLASALLGACSAGSVFSGTSDTLFDAPPYYAGAGMPAGAAVAHLPVGYQRGATLPSMFDLSDSPGTPVARLLAEMNAYLDSLDVSRPLPAGAPAGRAPDVQFGCEMDMTDDCVREPGRRDKRLALLPPSRSWVQSVSAAAADAGVGYVMVITLETGNILPRQRNLRGDKEIQLGTGYSLDAPWLTAIDRPASTLQLTGAVVDGDGRVVRMGAEGLVARRTNLLVGSLGAQALISDEDVERARSARREDLPGRPLVWEVALRNLTAQLAGRADLVVR